MPRRYMMLMLALLTLQACASTDPLSRKMAGWQEQPVEAAINEWGEPEERVLAGDQTILVWRDRVDSASAYGEAAYVLCERQLAVDASGRITGWRWRGNSCPAIDDPAIDAAFFAATK